MSASSVNTSRELGAVAGVAVLGAILNGQITSTLARQLAHVPGLTHAARDQVIVAVTTGNLPTSGPLVKIVGQVVPAVSDAFNNGLDFVLSTAGAMMLASAVAAAFLVRRRGAPVASER